MTKQERVNLTIPDALKRKARIKAISEGKNLSQVVREFLRQYIESEPSAPDDDKAKGN